MEIDKKAVATFLGRHAAIIAALILFVIFGGLHKEQIQTFKAAALAVTASIILSHFVLLVYTKDNFQPEEARDARTWIFIGVCLLVGLVYAGSFFVEFSPTY